MNIPLRILLHLLVFSYHISSYLIISCHISSYLIISHHISLYLIIYHYISLYIIIFEYIIMSHCVSLHLIMIRYSIISYIYIIFNIPHQSSSYIPWLIPHPMVPQHIFQVDATPAPSRRGRKPSTLQHLS